MTSAFRQHAAAGATPAGMRGRPRWRSAERALELFRLARRWLGPESRCVVPFTSFSELNREIGGDNWFALDESRPLAVFAGLWKNGLGRGVWGPP